MATASLSGKAVRDDGWRNTGARDSSDCGAALANTRPSDEERFYPAPSASFYHSTRIQRMIDARSREQSETTEASTVQAEIEASKVTWSELANGTVSRTKQLVEANQKYFECLKRNKYRREADQIIAMELTKVDKPRSVPSSFQNMCEFLKRGKYVRKRDQIVAKERTEKEVVPSLFRDYDTLIVGEKLAEGGQAEIYAATLDIEEDYPQTWESENREPMVVKVFKAGTLLSDLEKQWHPAFLKNYELSYTGSPSLPSIIVGATLLKDKRLLHRFAFVMPRYWGDLRKLIDHQMIHQSHNRGPPFSLPQIFELMYRIASDMSRLHGQHPPILHRDLKAANVLVAKLVPKHERVFSKEYYFVNVADYECSVGVVGTGFWRAPEILLQLKDRDPDSPLDLQFTDKCDVYSYGMLCYEIVTGRIPFEDCSFDEARELVLNGGRPELPMDLMALVKDIIVSCWHAVPSERPSFEDIIEKVWSFLEMFSLRVKWPVLGLNSGMF